MDDYMAARAGCDAAFPVQQDRGCRFPAECPENRFCSEGTHGATGGYKRERGRSTSSPACTPQARKANTESVRPGTHSHAWPRRIGWRSPLPARPFGPQDDCCGPGPFSIAARISPPDCRILAARSSWGTDSNKGWLWMHGSYFNDELKYTVNVFEWGLGHPAAIMLVLPRTICLPLAPTGT